MDSDEELVRRAKQGDRTAFDALHTKHIEDLTRYCTRLLRNEQEGEQAAQDTLLLAWKYLASFRGDGRFESWLRSIATDVCLKLVRTKKGKDALQRQSLDDPAIMAGVELRQFADGAKDGVEDDVVMRLFAQQIVRRVLECGRTAKPRWDALDLDIFELHYVQGVESRREVARRLEENENKIKFRIYRHIEPVFKKIYQEFEAECTGF